jgi:hypothetical protein
MSANLRNLSLDPTTGDLAMAYGNLVIATGSDAVRQALMTRLRFARGEWFIDESIGIPWLARSNNDNGDYILGAKGPPLPAIKEIFRKAILASPGIASVTSLDVVYDGTRRTASISFTAVQDNGALLVVDTFQLGVVR